MWSKLGKYHNIRWDQNFLKLLFEYLILGLNRRPPFTHAIKPKYWLSDSNWISVSAPNATNPPFFCSVQCPNYFAGPLHTVSFNWFLSSLEWIHNLEFCCIKLFIFYHKWLWNIRSRLTSSTFWVFGACI